jgi:FAD/FMN-containing dehydrogenase
MSTIIERDESVRRSFAADVSGLVLVPEGVARPTSVEEVAQVVSQASAERTTVTAAGGQTSTTGASISDRGVILSLRGLDRIIGSGHPHQNFIARDGAERDAVERVIEATLRHVLSVGGTVSAEHGIGKLKRRWLPLQATPAQVGVMRAVKNELDPRGILVPGNIFE